MSFFSGYRSKTSGKEKEVDVKLAVDIVDFAHRDKYYNLWLFSGDADFMHALIVAGSLNKRIFVLALENRLPRRFSYIYPTYLIVFGKECREKIFSEQKIKILFMDRGNFLEDTK